MNIYWQEDQAEFLRFRQIFDDFFDGKKSLTGFSPDEAVCYGAGKVFYEDLYLGEIKITPFSLGIESKGGIMTKIIHKGSIIPTKKYLFLDTILDN